MGCGCVGWIQEATSLIWLPPFLLPLVWGQGSTICWFGMCKLGFPCCAHLLSHYWDSGNNFKGVKVRTHILSRWWSWNRHVCCFSKLLLWKICRKTKDVAFYTAANMGWAAGKWNTRRSFPTFLWPSLDSLCTLKSQSSSITILWLVANAFGIFLLYFLFN